MRDDRGHFSCCARAHRSGRDRDHAEAQEVVVKRWLAFCAILGCAAAQATAPSEPAKTTTFAALIPEDGPNAPSQIRITERDPRINPSDVDTCATCHGDVAEQWKTSAHFFASFDNPIYRASVLRFRDAKGNDKSRFCGGCHDPSLMVDGAMDHAIASDDLRAFSGVTCRTCHGTVHARADGNGSLDLRIADIELPKNGDSASIERHKKAAAPAPLRTASLCIGCHRVFLDEGSGNAHHLPGQDEGTPWMRSAFAGSMGERVDEDVTARDCRGCHMPKEDATLGDAAAKNGKITSHRFLGGHTWLASMRNDPDQVERLRAFMKNAVKLDVVAASVDGNAPMMLPSTQPIYTHAHVVVDVTIENTGVGHRFPAGTLDAQDTWVELRAFDGHGKLVATAGVGHEKGEPLFTPDTHVLRAVILDDQGKPVLARETDQFRTTVVNNTIGPRDAALVQYSLDIPSDLVQPLRFVAKLRHRARNQAVQDASCAHVKTDSGRSYDAGFEKSYAFAKRLDACKMQPIDELAEASAEVGSGAPFRDTSKDFARAWAWSKGAMHLMLERLDEARVPLEMADKAARNPTEHAMALSLLGQVDAKQGRVTEALMHIGSAQEHVPTHPFFDRVRGEALASTWREAEAGPRLCDAATSVLRDDGLFSELAVTLGSASEHGHALEAARYALALQPRDDAALRVQALSLEALGADPSLVRRAKDAWLTRRIPDDGSSIKAKCSANIPGCAAERDPVRIHPMRML
jgi:tetratricopeptide (TPR) repeat protein